MFAQRETFLIESVSDHIIHFFNLKVPSLFLRPHGQPHVTQMTLTSDCDTVALLRRYLDDLLLGLTAPLSLNFHRGSN